jgi:hypothetical protein
VTVDWWELAGYCKIGFLADGWWWWKLEPIVLNLVFHWPGSSDWFSIAKSVTLWVFSAK